MKYLLTFLLLWAAWGFTSGQFDSTIVCNSDVGVVYNDVHVVSGGVAAPFVVFNDVTADSFKVWMRDSFVMTEGAFGQFAVYPVACTSSIVATDTLTDAWVAYFYNDMVYSLLQSMMSDTIYLRTISCDGNQAELKSQANVIRSKLDQVVLFRALLKSHLSGIPLQTFIASEFQDHIDINSIYSHVETYKTYLNPCKENQLGGQTSFIIFALERLLYSHGQYKILFRP